MMNSYLLALAAVIQGLAIATGCWNLDYAFMCARKDFGQPEYLYPFKGLKINFGYWINIQYFQIFIASAIPYIILIIGAPA